MDDFDFLGAFEDEFEDDEIFGFLDSVNPEDLEPDHMEMFDDTEVDELLSFLMPGLGCTNDVKEGLELCDMPPTDCPPGKREIPTFSTVEYIASTGIVREQGEVLLFIPDLGGKKRTANALGVEIGRVKAATGREIGCNSKDVFSRANRLAEENGGKGTGLGFSNFYHSAACISLCSRDAVIEPQSGLDVEYKHISIEMTGNNYKKRETKANWVINKYLLLGFTTTISERERYEILSFNEDNKIFSSFRGTAFDQGDSPYSKATRSILDSISLLTDFQKDAIKKQFLHWLRQRYETKATTKKTLNVSPLLEFINSTSKHKDGQGKLSSPFRVLTPKNFVVEEEAIVAKREECIIESLNFSLGGSTFRTRDVGEDVTQDYWVELQDVPEYWVTTGDTVAAAYHRYCRNRGGYQYAYIQSELTPKIAGTKGSYYSRYSGVGIAWDRSTREHLIWDCCYYTFTEPQDERLVGKWEKKTTQDGMEYWRSATFRLSRSDIHQTVVNSHRFLAMLSGVRTLCEEKEFFEIIPNLARALSLWTDSSWRTSVIAGNSRFITSCHLSNSGDLQTLMTKGLIENKPLRFSDYAFVQYCINFINDYDHVSHGVTPLFRLPAKLAALEKDVCLGMQWHIRGKQHATDCMDKLIKVHLEELDTREADTAWMTKQANFLRTIVSKGANQDAFNSLLDSKPDHPTMDVCLMIACGELSKKSMEKMFDTQTHQKFSLWGMLTDHHSMARRIVDREIQYEDQKVADCLTADLNSYDSITGPYDYLTQQMIGELIEFFFGMHEKDAKSANRDISIMEIRQRISQYFTESMVNIYNLGVTNDLMMDPAKYQTFVQEAVKVLSSEFRIASSEDRSNFCGQMHPEKMSICTAIVAMASGTTALVSAASMQSVNTKRKCIFPRNYRTGSRLEGTVGGTAIRRKGGVTEKVPYIEMHNHMMQGIYSGGAGLVNTLFSLGMLAAQKEIQPCIKKSFLFTTSDDLARGATFKKGCDVEAESNAFVAVPNSMLDRSMMVENKAKPIVSDNIAEFNNVIVTKDGMVPQSPIHATLCVQPLLGTSFIMDLITLVSSSRQTLAWGDSPDMAMTALFAGAVMLRQKWLVTEEEWHVLIDMGLIPRNIEEMVEGFYIRNSKVMSSLWSQVPEDMKESVRRGNIPLHKSLFAIEGVDLARVKKTITRPQLKHDLPRYKHVLDGIIAARKTQSRINPKFIQAMPVARRRAAFCKFLSIIREGNMDLDITELDRLRPPRVIAHFRRHKKINQMPTSMGSSAVVDMDDLRRIRTWRECQLVYRSHLTQEEMEKSELPEDEFKQYINEVEHSKSRQGFSYKVPGGLPLTRILDGKRFLVPTSFNFDVSLEAQPHVVKPFTFEGNPVSEFKPMLWGGGSLFRRGGTLAFALGRIRGDLFAFYQDDTFQVRAIRCPETMPNGSINGIRELRSLDGNTGISCLVGNDTSTITLSSIESTFVPSPSELIGDVDAVVNYGGYLRSRQPGGFALWKQMFRSKRSRIPNFMIDHMLPYPNFHSQAIEIPRGRTVWLIGSKSIGKLKLTYTEEPLPVVRVDLSGDLPVVVDDSAVEIEFD